MNSVAYSNHGLLAIGFAVALWCGLLLSLELGRAIGARQFERYGKDGRAGVGVVDSAVYGLFAFLLGFIFSGAADRFDRRRELVGAEASAIQNAWQRIDLLAPDQQTQLRPHFRRYLDELIASHRAPYDWSDPARISPGVTKAQNGIWTTAVAMILTPRGEPARVLLVPALSEMFTSVEQEHIARRIHPPSLIYIMLVVTVVAAAVFIGYAMATARRRNWIYVIGVTTTMALATYVVIELEYPRLGWFRVDTMDQMLTELRATMR